MINLFFVTHDYSGARAYANELLGYLSNQKDIVVHKVYLESGTCKEYTEARENNILNIHIPKVGRKGSTLEKYACRCIDLLSPVLQGKPGPIFHLNHSTQVKLGLEARKRFNARLVYTLHYLPNYFSSFAMGTVDPKEVTTTGDVPDREICKQADQVICVTRFALEMLNQHYQTPLSKLHLIYNGVGGVGDCKSDLSDIAKEEIRQQLGFPIESAVILFVGRLMFGKGVEKLIKAFNKLIVEYPKARMVLVGDGSFSPFMELAKDNIGRVSFTGKLPFERVEQLYQIADIGIIPSEFEQCSYVALEMMGHGVPVVATNVPGMSELFADRENALLANLKERKDGLLGLEVDEQSLYVKMKLLLKDKALAKRLALNGRKKWENHFTAEHMGQETCRIYKDVLDTGKKVSSSSLNLTI